ncbi:MAG: hypothetical protein G01um101430_638 [Parcubacteria group bacterium Gr01-1014_30]|nr:MAG: hypothetical protein G01um101430_638 [Parcubacteria group bacterium Gr01-1014_30]
MLNRFFNFRSKNITFAASLLGASAILSAILGLIRDRLLASRFGAGQELDVYFAAFRIPDFVYGILIMGGLSAVFLPVLTEHFKKNEEQGWLLTNVVLNCFLVLLVLFCGALTIFTPFLISLIAPGFTQEQRELAVPLTRIMFLSTIFFGLSSIFSGILHYFNRFLAYSIAPVLYNLSIISGIIFFVPVFGVMGLAFGVILGAFLHLAIQMPSAAASGFRYSLQLNFKYPGLLKIFKFMAWRALGSSVYHINLIILTAIASTLALGSITLFNFAGNMAQFVTGIVGISFATAAFPVLSKSWTNGSRDEFLKNFHSTFRQILFLAIPLSVLIFLFRAQIVKLILGYGLFGDLETGLTAAALGLFCLGIFAFASIPLLLRAFFSLQDVKTPTVIGLVYMVLTVGVSFLFVWALGFPNFFHDFLERAMNLERAENIQVIGLPLAVSLSGILYFFLLLSFLRKKLR